MGFPPQHLFPQLNGIGINPVKPQGKKKKKKKERERKSKGKGEKRMHLIIKTEIQMEL